MSSIWQPTADEIAAILVGNGKWQRGEPGGKRADLGGANLGGANLTGASLYGADLTRANLTRANLMRANLGGANLTWATLPEGITWEKYLAEVVPALLAAGGKAVADVLAAGAWDCHQWTNCPMAVAFGVDSLAGVPILLRPRADEFVRYFDAQLIPAPRQLADGSWTCQPEPTSVPTN